MGKALVALESLQFGKETTPGTLVAADTVIQTEEGVGGYAPEIDRQLIKDNHGLRVGVTDLDVRKGTILRYRHALDFEQSLIPLNLGLKSVTPTGGAPDYVWTFEPSAGAPDALNAGTFEASLTDGTTRHLQREFGYATCSRFAISGGRAAASTIEADYFARKAQTSTYTAGQSALSRTFVPGALWTAFIDTSWAGLGGTQVSALVKSFKFECMTGAAPDDLMDGRTDLDFSDLIRGDIMGTLELDCEYTASGDAEYDAWEDKTPRYISLIATNGARVFEISGRFLYTAMPTFSADGPVRMVKLVGSLRYDATASKFLKIEVTNLIASI